MSMRLGTSLFLVAGLIGCSQSENNNGGTGGKGGSSSVVASSASGGASGGSSGGASSSVASSSASAGSAGSKSSSASSSSQTGGDGGTSSRTTAGTTGGRTGTGGTGTGTTASGGVAGGTTSTSTGGGNGGSGGRTGTATTGDNGGSKDGGAPDGTSTGSTGAGTYVPDPGWACGMADGIPDPKQGTLAFTIALQISATHDVGNTPYGKRRLMDVKGGTITGDKLKGSVETGGLDYDLVLSNGVVEYQAIYILKTSSNAMIYVRTCGMAPDANSQARVVPDFEAATSGSDAWLNTGKFVAVRTATTSSIQLEVYDVSKVTAGEPRVTITKPAGVPKQPWDCNKTTGTKGAEVLTEQVSLGSTFSINGKRGSRTVIPITGGTTTGKVVGKILPGGADYQNSGSLDAWYTLAPNNGEFILVRNCGAGSGLIPWFEAKVDGEFNFLNTQAYLSSGPGGGVGGGVSITFYERK